MCETSAIVILAKLLLYTLHVLLLNKYNFIVLKPA
jgi:hypothetical protein